MTRGTRALLLSVAVVAGLACPFGASGRAEAQAAAAPIQTERRPDVIFVPTRELVIEAMLNAAKVGPNDVVYDLGCGDGRIVDRGRASDGARGGRHRHRSAAHQGSQRQRRDSTA